MKLSKYIIVNGSIFLAAVLFLLLTPFSVVFNILSLLLFGVSFIMLSVFQAINFNDIKKRVNEKEQELILELATEDNGEAYVYNNDKIFKKRNKQINNFFRDRKFTILFLFILGLAFCYFSIRLIIIAL